MTLAPYVDYGSIEAIWVRLALEADRLAVIAVSEIVNDGIAEGLKTS